MIRGQLREPPDLNLDPKVQDVHWLAKAPFVTVDIETFPEDGDEDGFTAKLPTRAKLNILGIGTPEFAISFRWRDKPELHTACKKLLANPKQVHIFQNGWFFDIPILKRYGIEVK